MGRCRAGKTSTSAPLLDDRRPTEVTRAVEAQLTPFVPAPTTTFDDCNLGFEGAFTAR